MSFLAPGFLVAAALAALAVVGLHLLAPREPRVRALPTARFVPEVPLRGAALDRRWTHRRLLALRVLILLLVGAALARPVPAPSHRAVARVVLVDHSRAVADFAEVRDSAARYLPGAAAVIRFSATARDHGPIVVESLHPVESPRARQVGAGSLSAALVVARRAAIRLRGTADSLELVLISPLAAEERDAATMPLRALWPGRIHLVPVARGAPPATDSVTLAWADSAPVALWRRRHAPDTVGALQVGGVLLVHALERRWELAAPPDSTQRVFARWVDGSPAALEWSQDRACVRSLGFTLPSAGEAPLRPAYRRLVAALGSPCGAPWDLAALPGPVLDTLRGAGPLAAASALPPHQPPFTPAMAWCLAAAMLLLLAELVLRGRAGPGDGE